MSLIYTESFIAFGTYNGGDDYDPAAGAGAAARSAYALNLARAGYEVKTSANTSKDTSGGFVVRADAVYPQRNALTHSSDVTAGVNAGVTAAFRRTLPQTDRQIIIGFSLFIPGSYVPNPSASTVPCFRMASTLKSDATWTTAVANNAQLYNARELFRVADDLSVRWGTDAAQSSKRLKPGVMNYLEVRISPNEVSVWIDDVFVMQKLVGPPTETVAWIFENNANAGSASGGTNMSGAPGRWQIGNMYVLFNDGVAPTVRLGPTTRVIGSRPDTDVDVRFIRPSDAPTNASVAAQDLVDAPARQLQSTLVGDYDTYSSNQSAGDIQTMGMIHAVATKVLAQNLEPDVHAVRPYLKYGSATEAADVKPRDLSLLTTPASTRTIRGMIVRPADKTLWVYGDGESIYVSGANFDLTTWTRVKDTGSAASYTNAALSDSGYLGFYCPAGVSGGGRIDYVAPGTLTLTAATLKVVSQSTDYLAMLSISGDSSRWLNWPKGTSSNMYYSNGIPGTGYTLVSIPVAAWGGAAVASRGDYVDWARANGIVVSTMSSATGFVTVQANGGTVAGDYTSRDVGDASVAYTAVTWDGRAWLVGGVSNDNALGGGPRIRRSTDPAASGWAAVTAVGSSITGAGQVLRKGASNTATYESVFVGDGGAIVASADGINWRNLTRLTTNALYAVVCLPNGDFVMGGVNGTMLVYRSTGQDTPLLPLAGYTMAFGSAALNPSTGKAWTTTEAAGAQFGVRLTT